MNKTLLGLYPCYRKVQEISADEHNENFETFFLMAKSQLKFLSSQNYILALRCNALDSSVNVLPKKSIHYG